MAKSIAEKLHIKPGATLWVWPAARLGLLGPLPDGATLVDGIGDASAAFLFVDDAATARAALAAHAADLAKPEYLWFCYPKGGRADINRDSLWPMVAEHGVRPITQIAIDETWSALRFRQLKPGEAPFMGGA
jgi:hypothetical protein